MQANYVLLIGICLVAIIVLMINIGVVNKRDPKIMRWVCIVLFAFSMTRYFTLIVYGDAPTLAQLESLRYFYLATSIGLTMTTAAAVWYISPYIKDNLAYPIYLASFLPFIVFYLFVIITQPTEIRLGETYGYTLELVGRYPIYLAIVQSAFTLIMLVLCAIGLVKYKNAELRSRYWMIILAQVLLTLDGLSFFKPRLGFFPPFTVTEIFGFLAILYAFSTEGVKKSMRQR